MEKKKNNPFHVVLILVALVIGGGLLGFGFMKKSEFDEKTNRFQSQSNQIFQMESMNGYPSDETVKELTNNLIAYKGKIEGLRNALKTSADGDFKNIPPGKFASVLEDAVSEVKDLYAVNEIGVSPNWYLGFEKYTTIPAPKAATGELVYQMGAIKWLHETLAKYKPSELNNIYRKPLLTEKSGDDTVVTETKQHVALPIELTFTAYEEDARAFINEVIKENKYLFTVDTVKIKLLPPFVEEVEEEEEIIEEEAGNAFEDIFEIEDVEEVDGDDEAVEEEEEFLSDEKLFNQELGSEMITIFIDLNLTYLKTQEALPEITKN